MSWKKIVIVSFLSLFFFNTNKASFLNGDKTWAFFEHVHLQYPWDTLTWHDIEVFKGLSTSFCLLPSYLNFNDKIKLDLLNFHFNLITLLYDIIRGFGLYKEKKDFRRVLQSFCLGRVLINFHLLSFKFFNFIDLKLISITGLGIVLFNKFWVKNQNFTNYNFDVFKHSPLEEVNGWYLILTPVIQIDIAKIIDYFRDL